MSDEKDKAVDAEIVDRPTAKKIKKPLGQRFKEAFFVTSKEELKRFVIQEVVLPGVRDILSDVISRGSDKLLYGDGRGRRSSRGSRGSTWASYQDYYDKGKKKEAAKTASKYSCEPVFWEGPDAQSITSDILDWCANMIEEYEQFSVYQFYSECGVTVDYTDHNWGWDSIEGFRSVKERGGWSIYPPKPIRLKD